MKAAVSETSNAANPAAMGRLLESVNTRSSSAKAVLEQLDSYGIEWLITEKGALWIKYWQIGAEDFVPVEKVGELMEGKVMHSEANALEWVSRNLIDLRSRYAGKWVAVVGDRVASFADDLATLMRQVYDAEIDQPFITQIPAEKVVWITTYANQGL